MLPERRAVRVLLVVLAVAAATVAATLLEDVGGLVDASPIFLVAVVLAAGLLGTSAAVVTSLASFLAYDFLFTTPRFTFTVADPAEWLSLLLFLLVAVVIGRLTSLLRDRADEADRRARESVALAAISRETAMAPSFADAASLVVDRLRSDAEMDAVWVRLVDDDAAPIALAGALPASGPTPWTLARSAADGTSDWLHISSTATDAPATNLGADASAGERYLVPIEGDMGPVGWIGASRVEGDPRPGRGARRLLALAADQLASAHRRDGLRAELTAAEVVRQSDRLRAAILDAVSHDLRTPIASIRALAGGLEDAAVEADPAAVRAAAAAIDREGTRLGDLVNGLLDMSRIQAGAVRPTLEAFDLTELVAAALAQERDPARASRVRVDINGELPVLADEVMFAAAFGNIVDNALRHAAGSSMVRVRAVRAHDGRIVLDVDDDGAGVPAEALPHLFDRFYRVSTQADAGRKGLGLGLAIARGFVEAIGGSISAERSDLGGLRIRLTLQAAPAEDDR